MLWIAQRLRNTGELRVETNRIVLEDFAAWGIQDPTNREVITQMLSRQEKALQSKPWLSLFRYRDEDYWCPFGGWLADGLEHEINHGLALNPQAGGLNPNEPSALESRRTKSRYDQKYCLVDEMTKLHGPSLAPSVSEVFYCPTKGW
jgi:hypothetical protein